MKSILFHQRSKAFDAKDKATLRFVEITARNPASVREDVLKDLKQYYSEAQIVELALVAALANFTNRFNDALLVEPDLG